MRDRYDGDCAVHAVRIAALLLSEGREPWIGRIRWIERRGEAEFRGPLIPIRFLGNGALAWSTHFVACAGRDAYDPIAGEPLDIDAYGTAVFGRALHIETHLDAEATRDLIEQNRPFPR